MIHPSYSELMQEVNKETEIDEPPVVNSRYSIVLATSKRARQIIGGDTPLVPRANGKKPLSVAIEELYRGEVKIMPEDGRKDEGGLTEMEALQEDMEEMVQENAEIENSGVEDTEDADIAEEYETEEISAMH
ncbi:MAG: DNA-directed RNA polymerase subunit omega [Lachnospiraceae bacterium]|nr:DNA-directed RNA polymerase subunit omega [Lachnospiraceae bacterium]MCI9100594.1 DNA-directed RNA polymerase subunit omega [Lachnospiraceae bacterium]MCI9357550.1 DNA-directed RNA polymerase subunit omega [Lachnospiraceae bacterium]